MWKLVMKLHRILQILKNMNDGVDEGELLFDNG